MLTIKIQVEDLLWLFLAGLVCLLRRTHWESWMLLGVFLGSFLFGDDSMSNTIFTVMGLRSSMKSTARITTQDHASTKVGPKMPESSQLDDHQQKHNGSGRSMSIVLIPALLQLMAHFIQMEGHQQFSPSSSIGLYELNSFQVIRNTSVMYEEWNRYAKIATILAIPDPLLAVILCVLTFALVPISTSCIRSGVMQHFGSTCAFLLGMGGWLLSQNSKSKRAASWRDNVAFSDSFTYGEWKVVCMLFLVACAEYMKRMMASNEIDSAIDSVTATSGYGLVALAGGLSCCACASLGNTQYIQEKVGWRWRLGLTVLGPLLFVEGSLYSVSDFRSVDYGGNYDSSSTSTISTFSMPMPLAFRWLADFLFEYENGYQRYWGLIYWIGILFLGAYPTFAVLSISSNTHKPKPSVVVTRKWFHLIAVLLFGPITWIFPQLMSLSYAIAACLLVVMETLRISTTSDRKTLNERNDSNNRNNHHSFWTRIESFYLAFVDDHKETGDQFLISHICLIVGCALPLWIEQVLATATLPPSNTSRSIVFGFLSEFGVLCIGIGDAMGALFGKTFGRHPWNFGTLSWDNRRSTERRSGWKIEESNHRRTLEGSFAMWCSMILVGMAMILFTRTAFLAECAAGEARESVVATLSPSKRPLLTIVFVATTFSTLLEAATDQLDNLVLPMSGSCIILWLSAAVSVEP